MPADIAAETYSRDPDDDKFVQLALAGQASLLVSGDLDLLDLGEVGGIQMVTPAAACAGLQI